MRRDPRQGHRATPIVAGLKDLPKRVVPRLDPVVEDRLASAVAWHGWLLGSLLDLTDAAEARSQRQVKRKKAASATAEADL